VTGNLYVLVALADAMMSFLPTVGPAAARRSRSILRRLANRRVALTSRVTGSMSRSRAALGRTGVAGPNAAPSGEALSP
jgi:hypothetical protein